MYCETVSFGIGGHGHSIIRGWSGGGLPLGRSSVTRRFRTLLERLKWNKGDEGARVLIKGLAKEGEKLGIDHVFNL